MCDSKISRAPNGRASGLPNKLASSNGSPTGQKMTTENDQTDIDDPLTVFIKSIQFHSFFNRVLN